MSSVGRVRSCKSCRVITYGKLKTLENFKQSTQKVVAVGYERWSLTRGFDYSDLTGKASVFFEK